MVGVESRAVQPGRCWSRKPGKQAIDQGSAADDPGSGAKPD